LAILVGVVVSLTAAALIPALPQWAMVVIGGVVTGLCAPVAVSRNRTSKAPEQARLTDISDDNDPGNEERESR
jgi:hypothetical protein